MFQLCQGRIHCVCGCFIVFRIKRYGSASKIVLDASYFCIAKGELSGSGDEVREWEGARKQRWIGKEKATTIQRKWEIKHGKWESELIKFKEIMYWYDRRGFSIKYIQIIHCSICIWSSFARLARSLFLSLSLPLTHTHSLELYYCWMGFDEIVAHKKMLFQIAEILFEELRSANIESI